MSTPKTSQAARAAQAERSDAGVSTKTVFGGEGMGRRRLAVRSRARASRFARRADSSDATRVARASGVSAARARRAASRFQWRLLRRSRAEDEGEGEGAGAGGEGARDIFGGRAACSEKKGGGGWRSCGRPAGEVADKLGANQIGYCLGDCLRNCPCIVSVKFWACMTSLSVMNVSRYYSMSDR